MRILILGATGRTGRVLLREALKRGHQVTILISHKGALKIKPELVEVYEGTPLNKFTLSDAMRGCDAVLSSLNISRVSDSPWSKLRTSKDFLSASMKHIIQAAGETNVRRVIITTAWGVSETRKDTPFWFRWLIDNSNVRYQYHDHEKQEALIKASNLDWTIIRPVGLTDSEKKREVKVSFDNQPKPSTTISRKNVALFMLDVLEKNLYTNQIPVISEK
ncbi:NAD(P)-dependent oxidoreductase [Mucilaginibacter sp. BT774]|uniref:NAD(P)-dependent oxidoreductase n=1 Tax=Mucilaginibacter sp. BT774 TaxID=3062276 RepID=UPI002674728A|nr:NAD(P)H-binding protein [Mucilaginibacter sp. BT774]MDO3624564.1 NAD(P)H-binding protein [Mucilaginibacter sp. BT774]